MTERENLIEQLYAFSKVQPHKETAVVAFSLNDLADFILEREARGKIKCLQDFQPSKHTDPEHLAVLMQEEICRLAALTPKATERKEDV